MSFGNTWDGVKNEHLGRLVVRVVAAHNVSAAGWLDETTHVYAVLQLGAQRYQTEHFPGGVVAGSIAFNTQVPAFNVAQNDSEVTIQLFRATHGPEAPKNFARGSCALTVLRSCIREQSVPIQLHEPATGAPTGEITIAVKFRPPDGGGLAADGITIELRIRTATGRVLSRSFRRGATVKQVRCMCLCRAVRECGWG